MNLQCNMIALIDCRTVSGCEVTVTEDAGPPAGVTTTVDAGPPADVTATVDAGPPAGS